MLLLCVLAAAAAACTAFAGKQLIIKSKIAFGSQQREHSSSVRPRVPTKALPLQKKKLYFDKPTAKASHCIPSVCVCVCIVQLMKWKYRRRRNRTRKGKISEYQFEGNFKLNSRDLSQQQQIRPLPIQELLYDVPASGPSTYLVQAHLCSLPRSLAFCVSLCTQYKASSSPRPRMMMLRQCVFQSQ